MSEEEASEPRGTPTDPSLEFDMFEMVRLRLVEALVLAGRGVIDAERAALYVVTAMRPASHLLKTATQFHPPEHGELLDAMSRVLDEAAALEKARQIVLGDGEGSDGDEADEKGSRK